MKNLGINNPLTGLGRVSFRLRTAAALLLGALVLTIPGQVAGLFAADPTDTFYGTGAGNDSDPYAINGANSAFGYQALYNSLQTQNNTAVGYQALYTASTGGISGDSNAAVGYQALYHDAFGDGNVANGASALYNNVDGFDNVANGAYSLYNNLGVLGDNDPSGGFDNVANGAYALYSNTYGRYNSANGAYAIYNNTTGFSNSAEGLQALYSNTTGSYNSAVGVNALYHGTTGGNNTADGFGALFKNTSGGSNIAVGTSAGTNLTTGSGNIDIGNAGVAAEAQTIRVGSSQSKTFISGIHGTVVSGGVPVYVSANGQLGTSPSSKEFKEAIKPMARQSEAILSLHPVTFRYKEKLDPRKEPQFGLIAEEVAKVDPDLVARDTNGKIYSVRYEAVNAMLLNEFLKEHHKVEILEAAMDQQLKTIATLAAGLKEQAEQLQKVSARVEADRTSPHLVANP